MELILGLAGLLGISALVQSKALPTEKEYNNAIAALGTKPDDPALNLTAGKYLAFVLGEWPAAIEHLSKSSDKALAGAAQKELDPTNSDTAVKQVGLGDEWVKAAKSYPALSTKIYDHASDWYAKAFPKLDALWKTKVREQGKKLAASRPPGPAKKFPSNWVIGNLSIKAIPSADGSIAHTGSYSIKLPEKDLANPKVDVAFETDRIPVQPKQKVEVTVYGLADQTDDPGDSFYVHLFDATGTGVGTFAAVVPIDMPVWRKFEIKGEIPANIVFITVGILKRSKAGTIWVDDFSVKLDGKESVKNGSFEEK
jgi:hypothetical protein